MEAPVELSSTVLTVQIASITVQLFGALFTVYGLWYASNRARHGDGSLRSWVRRVWSKLRRQDQPVTVHATAAMNSVGVLSADAYAEFTLNGDVPVEEQLRQLADQSRQLRRMIAPAFSRLDAVDRSIEAVRRDAKEAATQALRDAQTAITELRNELDQDQAVDLTRAMIGVAVAAVGTFLGYWA